MTHINEKLKPCPFCGANAFIWKDAVLSHGFKVSCEKDCVTMPPRRDTSFSSVEAAIDRWNTRAGV